jgi:hypothetical protein
VQFAVCSRTLPYVKILVKVETLAIRRYRAFDAKWPGKALPHDVAKLEN